MLKGILKHKVDKVDPWVHREIVLKRGQRMGFQWVAGERVPVYLPKGTFFKLPPGQWPVWRREWDDGVTTRLPEGLTPDGLESYLHFYEEFVLPKGEVMRYKADPVGGHSSPEIPKGFWWSMPLTDVPTWVRPLSDGDAPIYLKVHLV